MYDVDLTAAEGFASSSSSNKSEESMFSVFAYATLMFGMRLVGCIFELESIDFSFAMHTALVWPSFWQKVPFLLKFGHDECLPCQSLPQPMHCFLRDGLGVSFQRMATLALWHLGFLRSPGLVHMLSLIHI